MAFGVRHPVVSVLPEIMSGAPVFPGTRVPVQNLLICLEVGDSIDGFPTVFHQCLDRR
jgi:uncharacterized protein (DUF433 family)